MAANAGAPYAAGPLRLFLLLAALDSLIAGGWIVLQPGDLFIWLDVPTTRDGLLLSRAVGALILTHVPCLVLPVLQPRSWSGLVLVPLVGRTLLAGVSLWLLNSDRVHPSPTALHWLLVHDVAWLPGFIAFLVLAPCAANSAPVDKGRMGVSGSPVN